MGETSEELPDLTAALSPPFRLPETWYRNNVERLQARLQEQGLDGILLEDAWNIIYFSGLFFTPTERPFWLFIPAKGKPVLFHPALDLDLAESWWIEEREWYFDFPHSGPYNALAFEPGPRQDLWAWVLENLAARGFGRATLGVEEEPNLQKAGQIRRVLPHAVFKVAGDLCLRMRQIKTPEEIALIRKAVGIEDYMLAYARNLILEHGPGITDLDVRLETERHTAHLLMQALQPDGRPHVGVGIDLRFGCRAGVATAYPHPNQFPYRKIARGDAVQIAAFVHLGGYVGEGYRALQVEPMTDLHRRMWHVHTEMVRLQAELCGAGAACNEIAAQVLQVARDAGMARFVRHRPAHGIGMEGHQSPYLSLGDDTVLEEGMVLSNEPGLYNPEGGWGYNHSNTILVGRGGGIVLNRTPLTPEWCWLAI